MTVTAFPTRETVTSSNFSHDEITLISEALRIAQAVLVKESTRLEIVYPNSPMVEKFRQDAERMADLREAIE